MGFHELGHDLVLAAELGFELLDLLVLGVLEGAGLAAGAAVGEGEVGVLEELALPLVEEGRIDRELIAEVRDRDPSSRWRLTMATFSWGVK